MSQRDIKDDPFMERELAHLKRVVRNWEDEVRRRDALPCAQQELAAARAELREWKFKAINMGYKV